MTFEPESLPEDFEREEETIRFDRDAGEYAHELAEGTNSQAVMSTREKRIKERERTCALRLPDVGGWCVLHVKHTGPCKGIRAAYGPLQPPPDRKIMSSFRSELAQKYNVKKDGTGVSPADRWVAIAEGR